MNDDNPPGRNGGPPGHQGLRLLALLTVIAGVLALAAAAFVFSYAPVYDIARAAGLRPGLARFYPALPDAVLVVACAAALALRGAHWWARWLVWLSIIALVALVGAADAVHAMAIKLPRRPAAAAVAVLPWALLLLGFRLWLSVLRHTRKDQARPAPPVITVAAAKAAATADAAMASPAADSATASPVADPGIPGLAILAPAVRPDPAPEPATAGSTPASPARVATEPGAATPSAATLSAATSAATPASPAAGAMEPGGATPPVILRGLDLILPPYPDEAEAADPALAEAPAFDPRDAGEPATEPAPEPADANPCPDAGEPATEPAPERAEAEPEPAASANAWLDDAPLDAATDHGGIGGEGRDVIGEGYGRDRSPGPFATDPYPRGRAPQSATSGSPLGAPVPETVRPSAAVKDHVGAAPTFAMPPGAETSDGPSPPPDAAARAAGTDQPAAEHGTREPRAAGPETPDGELARPAARAPGRPAPESARSSAREPGTVNGEADSATDFRRVRSSPVPPEE